MLRSQGELHISKLVFTRKRVPDPVRPSVPSAVCMRTGRNDRSPRGHKAIRAVHDWAPGGETNIISYHAPFSSDSCTLIVP